MSLVNVQTGELIAECTPEEARALTDRIRSTTEQLWALLAEAHDRQAWAALGYDSFKGYVTAEFGMSKQRAYQLLDQARVIQALTEATGSTMVDPVVVSERDARDLKPILTTVVERVRETVETAPVAQRPQLVRDEIERAREEVRVQKAEDATALADLVGDAERAGFDMDQDRQTERALFASICRDLVKLPGAAAFFARQEQHLKDRHRMYAVNAHQWLTEFLEAWEG